MLTPGDLLDADSNALLTDGVWLWPNSVFYDLARYHLELPAAFIEHARQFGWRIESTSKMVFT